MTDTVTWYYYRFYSK